MNITLEDIAQEEQDEFDSVKDWSSSTYDGTREYDNMLIIHEQDGHIWYEGEEALLQDYLMGGEIVIATYTAEELEAEQLRKAPLAVQANMAEG